MGPEALAQVLRPLATHSHPDLIVGLQTSDDAAVFRISDDMAVVQTIDFFTPIVDDPYTYGAIAAANSLSDIYAMGADVLFALNVAAMPDDLPPDVLTRIFAGGADKVLEAGGVIAGGHTVTDKEPKYGLSVTGRIHPDRVLTKAGARPGDALFLSKPIGTGIVTTAVKNGTASAADLDAAVSSMQSLNRAASLLARKAGAHACTDITGFGLLGHAHEVAERSQVQLVIDAASVPLLPGSLRYVGEGSIPGGLNRNREWFGSHPDGGVTFDPSIPASLATLFYNPETSGGLLISVAEDMAESMMAEAGSAGTPLWRIGSVTNGRGIHVRP